MLYYQDLYTQGKPLSSPTHHSLDEATPHHRDPGYNIPSRRGETHQ